MRKRQQRERQPRLMQNVLQGTGRVAQAEWEAAAAAAAQKKKPGMLQA